MRDLSILEAALYARTEPLRIFFRDDDAGWADDRLECLCARFRERALPLDLALIPKAMDVRSTAVLERLHAQAGGLLHLHQHGFAHLNHQLQGRSAEFGADRSLDEQLDDIASGWRLLVSRLGESIEPIFTPPWNRCSQATVDALEALDFRCLSRITGSQSLLTEHLVELPVAIDWLKKRDGKRLAWKGFCDHAAPMLEKEPVVGVMLHHENMPDDDLADLDQLLDLLQRIPGARFTTMAALANEQAQWLQV